MPQMRSLHCSQHQEPQISGEEANIQVTYLASPEVKIHRTSEANGTEA